MLHPWRRNLWQNWPKGGAAQKKITRAIETHKEMAIALNWDELEAVVIMKLLQNTKANYVTSTTELQTSANIKTLMII